MPGLVRHDDRRSPNAPEVRVLLAEPGLPYERREVPLARPRPADPWGDAASPGQRR